MHANLRPLTHADAEAVFAIYAEGMATGNATFDTVVPDWPTWDRKYLKHSRLVWDEGGRVLGWVGIMPSSTRVIYRGVADLSVYVAAQASGRGIGQALLEGLIEASEANGVWTLQALILAENTVSRRLHARCGFREVGLRERVSQRDGVWRDSVLMERRSAIVGI
ncbi:MAG: N-acetyltransferase family protein [Bacteroidota bacterium]